MRVRKKKNGDARFDACKELFIEFDKENPEKLSLTELFPDLRISAPRSDAAKARLSRKRQSATPTWLSSPLKRYAT